MLRAPFFCIVEQIKTGVLYVDRNRRKETFTELDRNSNFIKHLQYKRNTELTHGTNKACCQSHMCTYFLKKKKRFCPTLSYVVVKKGHTYLNKPDLYMTFSNHPASKVK